MKMQLEDNIKNLSFAKLKAVVKMMFRERFGFAKSIKKVFPQIGDLRKKENWVTLFLKLLFLESNPREINAAKMNAVKHGISKLDYKIWIQDYQFVGCFGCHLATIDVDGNMKNLGELILTQQNKWKISGYNHRLFSSCNAAIEFALIKKVGVRYLPSPNLKVVV